MGSPRGNAHFRVLGRKELAGLFSDLNGRIRVRIILNLLLVGLLAAAGHAQETPTVSSASSSGGSSPSPSGASSPAERVILRVGDLQVTQADFESMVSALEAQQGPAQLSRRAIGDNYTSLLMLSQQAVAHNLETLPEVIRQLAIDRTQILSNAEFASLRRQATPTPPEISEYYSAHAADYDVMHLRRLFIWKKGEGSKNGPGLSAQDAKALADTIRQAYASGDDPRKPIHDTNDVVLDFDPISFQRGELPPRMEEAAFALGPGEWSVFEDTPGELVLLQGVGRGRKDLKEVSPQIERKLQAQNLRKELDDLKTKTGVWMDEQYFGTATQKPGGTTQSKATGPSKSVNTEEKNEEERQK